MSLYDRVMGLTANEYQEFAKTKARKDETDNDTLGCCALGLCGESGEIADNLKKHFYHGHKLDRDHLKKELGDLQWYIAIMASVLGYSLEEVMLANQAKLEKRYPEGFSKERSINRHVHDVYLGQTEPISDEQAERFKDHPWHTEDFTPSVSPPENVSPDKPQWVLFVDHSTGLVHVRWSVPDSQGKQLVSHTYPTTDMGMMTAEKIRDRQNAAGIKPADFVTTDTGRIKPEGDTCY